MSVVYESPVNTIHRADAREVAAQEEAGSFSLAVLDGPYAMQKAEWDRMKVADLPGWYAPHLDDVGRLCAASASLYVWNTAEGWATLHPGIVARGWVFAGLIVWNKTGAHPARIGAANAGRWPDVTEVCGHYQHGKAHHINQISGNVWSLAPTTDMNAERLWADTMRPDRVSGAMQRVGLHPCQKPLAFSDRIIRASTRPGERVWVPFGGTCREAVAAEWMARAEPDEARQVVTCEIDQDGRDYLGAVVRQLRGEDVRRRDPRQASLFGAA